MAAITMDDEDYWCCDDGKIYKMLESEPWTEELTVSGGWTVVQHHRPEAPSDVEIIAVFPAKPKIRVQPWREAKYKQ